MSQPPGGTFRRTRKASFKTHLGGQLRAISNAQLKWKMLFALCCMAFPIHAEIDSYKRQGGGRGFNSKLNKGHTPSPRAVDIERYEW